MFEMKVGRRLKYTLAKSFLLCVKNTNIWLIKVFMPVANHNDLAVMAYETYTTSH